MNNLSSYCSFQKSRLNFYKTNNSWANTTSCQQKQVQNTLEDGYSLDSHRHRYQQQQLVRLKMNLLQWRQRLAPNTDDIVSVAFSAPEPDVQILAQKQTNKIIANSFTQQDQSQFQSKNGNTNGPPDNHQNKVVIKKQRNKKKGLKNQQSSNALQAKFRISANSHLRREKRFHQRLWEYAIQQKFFYDNAKYRYQSLQAIASLALLSSICKQPEDYLDQTAHVSKHITCHVSINQNQYQKVISDKITNLFRRTSNLSTTFF